jgi:hypothetical protein
MIIVMGVLISLMKMKRLKNQKMINQKRLQHKKNLIVEEQEQAEEQAVEQEVVKDAVDFNHLLKTISKTSMLFTLL